MPDATFHNDLSSVPDGPTILLANEFLDALPIRQFVGDVERKIVITGGSLAFDRDEEIVERSPVRSASVTSIAAKLVRSGGAAIIVDYGHAASAPGETLQAVRGHGVAPLLADPGEQDLTAHVDFEAVAAAAREAGALVSPLVSQGVWLKRLGIETRAEALTAANPERASAIAAARDRLISSAGMGELFKVVALHSPAWPQPASFE